MCVWVRARARVCGEGGGGGDNRTFYYLWTNVVMSADLVRVELLMWLTTSFDPLFVHFKLGKRLWKGKKQTTSGCRSGYRESALHCPQQQYFPGIVTGQERTRRKVHCVSKTDCFVTRVSAALPTQPRRAASAGKYVSRRGCVTSFRALVGWEGWASVHGKVKVDHSVVAEMDGKSS